jgi:hypothetical protein
MADEVTERLRKLCEDSEKRISLPDFKAVQFNYAQGQPSDKLNRVLCDRLKTLIESTDRTEISPQTLLIAARTFGFERVTAVSNQDWDGVLCAIRVQFRTDAYFHPLDHPSWPDAIDLGRALLILHPNLKRFEGRYRNIADAAKRLRDQCVKLKAESGKFVFDDGELERASQRILADLSVLGRNGVMQNLFAQIQSSCEFWNGVYLFARDYSKSDRKPSLPFGFLINIAARVSAHEQATANRDFIWKNAIEFSRDIVAALNLEPYHSLESTHIPDSDIESQVREMALFDSLFTFRQWPLDETPQILRNFFGRNHESLMKTKLGWSVSNVIGLCETVIRLAKSDPTLFTRNDLLLDGLEADKLDALLPNFVHFQGTINKQYNSPIGAKADLMFKPFIEIAKDQYLLPARSIAGPAFYEATMKSLCNQLRPSESEKLRGDGTQRIVHALFRKARLNQTVVEKKYEMGSHGRGECDLVLESDASIVFVECKAKSLPRGAMVGESAEALIDFALSVLKSQVQALRHQRIICTVGRIEYCDGTMLAWRNRKLTRLTVTLLDHGSLQDRMLFWNLFDPLLRGQMSYTWGHPKAKHLDDLNSLVLAAQQEVEKLDKAGVHISVLKHQCASLNVGQLSLILKGIRDLDHFVQRITYSTTFLSFDPLFEFVHRSRKGLVD